MNGDQRYNQKTGVSHNCAVWLMRDANFMRNRYHIKLNGRSAYHDLYNQEYNSPMIPIVETVLYRAPMSSTGRLLQGKRYHKGDPVWHRGIYLGRTEESNEFIMGTREGALKVRSVRRLPVEGQADKDLFNSFIGTPRTSPHRFPEAIFFSLFLLLFPSILDRFSRPTLLQLPPQDLRKTSNYFFDRSRC